MKKLYIVVTLLMIFSFVLSGCVKATTAPTNKLAEILARGTLVISTDPAYPPQSQLVESAHGMQPRNALQISKLPTR